MLSSPRAVFASSLHEERRDEEDELLLQLQKNRATSRNLSCNGAAAVVLSAASSAVFVSASGRMPSVRGTTVHLLDDFWCCQKMTPPLKFQGTIKGPSQALFQPNEVAKNLRKAFRGLGTNEKIIITVLAAHTNAQRQEIKRAYGEQFGRNLVSNLEDELGGHFLETCLALMLPPHTFDSHCLRKAMKSYYVQGVGTNEIVLTEILCSRTYQEIQRIKQAYTQEYDRDLEEDVIAETSPGLGKLMRAVIQGKQHSAPISSASFDEEDLRSCEKDASALMQTGIKNTETELLNEILTTRGQLYLIKVLEIYRKSSGQDIEQEIRKNFMGELKDAYIALIKLVRNPPGFFAEKLHDCLRGNSATDDESLIRIIVSRSETDLQQIKEEYLKKYKKTLSHAVKDDTSGDYSRLLVRIIGRE